MTSDEIRARIADLEAEAERRAQPAAGRNRSGAPKMAAASADDDPWDSLFDAALLGGAGLDGAEFSLNRWLAEGLTGLRSSLRGMGLNDEFWGHLRGAERELLLAVRTLVDARLERVDEASRKPAEVSRLQEIEIE